MMPPAYDRETIIGLLDQHRQRATYGALATLLGGIARSVMQGLPKTPRNSWIVSTGTGYPSDYEESEMHAALHERDEILTTAEELREWLEGMA